MPKNNVPTKQATEEKGEKRSRIGTLRLMTLGAVGLAQDSFEDLFNRAVARGEKNVKNARARVAEQRKHRRFRTRAGTVATDVTKSDVEKLNQEIATLTAAIDELTAEKPETPEPVMTQVAGS